MSEMSSKHRLITDSFKVVKRFKREERKENPVKERDSASPPPSQRERELQHLRDFDLDWHYGPCTGITRLQRWERAELRGLQPPRDIRHLVQNHPEDMEYTHCLWHDYPL
ncbi:DNA polymerase delta subunit 4 isoform X2 [Amia ocellicauda]|uniref:DNA polymerase delta subunit 4 isoform X2 n=1 Tax=Amia ocellicauda TaxID=2972642 RepID=UPI00346459CE